MAGGELYPDSSFVPVCRYVRGGVGGERERERERNWRVKGGVQERGGGWIERENEEGGGKLRVISFL